MVINPAYLLKRRFILCGFLHKSIYCLSFYGQFLCNYDFIFLRVQVQFISTFTFRHDIIWKKRSFPLSSKFQKWLNVIFNREWHIFEVIICVVNFEVQYFHEVKSNLSSVSPIIQKYKVKIWFMVYQFSFSTTGIDKDQ